MADNRYLQIYIPEGFNERIDALMQALIDSGGIDLYDQRGYPSKSKLIRYLIDRALEEQDAPEAGAAAPGNHHMMSEYGLEV